MGRDDARQAAAFDSPDDDLRGGDRDHQGAFGDGPARRPRADHDASVPQPASYDLRRGPYRRWIDSAARRSEPRASWRAVPRRVARVSQERARGAAPAAGGCAHYHLARDGHAHVSRVGDVGGGDEPVPVRLLYRSTARMLVLADRD